MLINVDIKNILDESVSFVPITKQKKKSISDPQNLYIYFLGQTYFTNVIFLIKSYIIQIMDICLCFWNRLFH